MFPCGRRAFLAKTAGFKKMPEDIQTNYKKLYTNLSENHPQDH